jgi:hypothetical protein
MDSKYTTTKNPIEGNNNSTLETLKDNPSWGGARPNSGRPKGSENPATTEKKKVESEMKKRILKSVDSLLTSQMTVAHGVQMLYCITTNEKGIRSRPELITSPSLIEDFLAGELNENDKEYYFITTERPDTKAIDSLLDRTFGKARQSIGLDGGDKDKPISITGITYIQPNGNSDNPNNKATPSVGGSEE